MAKRKNFKVRLQLGDGPVYKLDEPSYEFGWTTNGYTMNCADFTKDELLHIASEIQAYFTNRLEVDYVKCACGKKAIRKHKDSGKVFCGKCLEIFADSHDVNPMDFDTLN